MLDYKLEAIVAFYLSLWKIKTILFNNDLDPYLQILLEHAGYEAQGI